jgi:short-subunit dehydrogenase
MQAVIPHFQERGEGHLINVSSFLATIPWVSVRSAYIAAKAAVDVLTNVLRMDLAEKYPGIHVSLAIPAVVLTEFGQNVIGAPPPRPASVPPNAQTAEDVAAAIASLVDHPRSTLYTNPTSPALIRRYREDPDAFVQQMIRRP